MEEKQKINNESEKDNSQIKYEKFLPIGSIVILKAASKRLMITGFCIKNKGDSSGEMYDYVGCMYPEGVIDTEKNFLFNHKDISKVFAIGYSDDEENEFKTKLDGLLKDIKG